MAHLPHFDPADVVTKSDIAAVTIEITELCSEQKSEIAGVRGGLAQVNQRLDRLFQTLLVGMFGVAAGLIGPILRIG